MYHS